MTKRGVIVTEIQEVAMTHIGREISQQELRLIPYVHFVLCNGGVIDVHKVNAEELGIIREWMDEGLLFGNNGDLRTTKRFWDYMSEVMYLGYAAKVE